jgi:two-component system OmpR family response regulator
MLEEDPMTAQSTTFPNPAFTALSATANKLRAPVSVSAPPVTVTIQVTLPGGRDAMSSAARLAARLHALTAVATVDSTPAADVSTTVAVVVDHTGPNGRSSSHRFARPTTINPDVDPLEPSKLVYDDAERERLNEYAELCINNARRDVSLNGVPLLLTRREYDLLLFLAGHPGRVFTRPQLLKWVWGYDIVSGERTVDVHVRRLRRKLRQQGPTITTIRGIGYRLDSAERIDLVD